MMLMSHIVRPPEPRIGRHGDHDRPARCESLAERGQRFHGGRQVLEHVEESDGIKHGPGERNAVWQRAMGDGAEA